MASGSQQSAAAIQHGVKRACAPLCLFLLVPLAWSHGNVALVDDQCYMELGFVEAHFTIYQPQDRGHEEFCEAIPYASETVFVLEDEHGGPYALPMDFRIIKDTMNLGQDAAWEDIVRIDDLESVTVFYMPPRLYPLGVFSSIYNFSEKGSYVGIVTATDPPSGQAFQAVFAFQVGALQMSPILWVTGAVTTLAFAVWLLLHRRRKSETTS